MGTLKGKDFGALLRTAREAEGLTLRELGRRAGISAPTLSRLENGAVSARFEDVCNLAQTLGRPLLYFASGRERTGGDSPDLIAQLHVHGLTDVASRQAVILGEAHPFAAVIVEALRPPTIARIVEAIPALLLANEYVPAELLAVAKARKVGHRLGWLAEIAVWISTQLPATALGPDAGNRARRIFEEAWSRRLREPKKNLARQYDLFGRPVPPSALTRGATLEQWFKTVPPITRKWRILYETPQEAFLERAQSLLGGAKSRSSNR